MKIFYTLIRFQKFAVIMLALIVHINSNYLSAQYIVNDIIYSTNSVTNDGKVSGYETQGGNWSIWLPDSANAIVNIGGVAPGLGVGGQARFSENGNFICGTSMGNGGAEISLYDRSLDTWTALGSLGFSVDSTKGGGYGISGDGNVVVGNSWADTTGGLAYTHAVAHNNIEGLMDLGTLFFGRSTRANATNYDGSVVVGWQDFNGPWKSAVWRKNPAGGYFPNEYILIDTAGNPNDEYNQIGECSAVSADGNWIGGYGDFANNNEPWIWSRDSGVINLGTFPGLGNGYVSGISADGSIVVGWFDGFFFGDPRTPFIWTHENGLQEFNTYIRNELGDSTYTHQVYTAESISPNGLYVAGYGVDTSTFLYFAYRVTLNGTTGISSTTSETIEMYPNPTSGFTTIENKGQATLTVSDIRGRVVIKTEINGKYSLDLTEYNSGIYFVTILSNDKMRTSKIIKN